MSRDIFSRALVDELARTLPRDAAEDLVRIGLFRVDRAFKRQLLCGARCSSTGKPCRAHALKSGRCRWHGGLSSGPKTEAGKARIAAAQRRRWAIYRKSKEETST